MKELDCGQAVIISLCRCPESRQGSQAHEYVGSRTTAESPRLVGCSWFDAITIMNKPRLRFVHYCGELQMQDQYETVAMIFTSLLT